MSQELIVSEDGAVDLRVGRAPNSVLAEAQLVSNALANYAHKHQLYKEIGPSKHLMIEGWQMVGSMYRVSTRLVEDRFVEYGDVRGFEATAEAIYIPTGQTISRATAMCLDDEENWGTRPKYEWVVVDGKKTKKRTGDVPVPLQQLRSMAQTRASSKVLSNLFKWVAKLGGFAGTPGEELTGREGNSVPPPAPKGAGEGEYSHQDKGSQQPQKTAGNSDNPDAISEAQAKRMFAIAKQAGYSKDQYESFIKFNGYPRDSDVLKKDYDRMVAELQKSDSQ